MTVLHISNDIRLNISALIFLIVCKFNFAIHFRLHHNRHFFFKSKLFCLYHNVPNAPAFSHLLVKKLLRHIDLILAMKMSKAFAWNRKGPIGLSFIFLKAIDIHHDILHGVWTVCLIGFAGPLLEILIGYRLWGAECVSFLGKSAIIIRWFLRTTTLSSISKIFFIKETLRITWRYALMTA